MGLAVATPAMGQPATGSPFVGTWKLLSRRTVRTDDMQGAISRYAEEVLLRSEVVVEAMRKASGVVYPGPRK